jgi:uncharacterized membrane protein
MGQKLDSPGNRSSMVRLGSWPLSLTQVGQKMGILGWMVLVSSLVLFCASSFRHLVYQSTAYDLGYFDQALYLLSQGLPPVVSFWGFHFMGGHADWILYFVAFLYKIQPSVYWLFGLQAVSLSMGAVPVWHLGRRAGLKESQAIAIAFAYLLYPLIFNLNLFDFHPEVMALPLMLVAILMAQTDHIGWFVGCLVLILGCRDALSLTVAAMGLWLLLFEKKRICGAIALFMGSAWFVIVTQVVIPQFRPGGVEAVPRYGYLGSSIAEILLNLILKPQLVLGGLLTLANLGYLCLLILPLGWGLFVRGRFLREHPWQSWRHLFPLVGALPTLAMNLLTTVETQKDLIHQYSLPAVSFLIMAVIYGVASGTALVLSRRGIVVCACIGFILLSKIGYFWFRYLRAMDTWTATSSAIAQIQPSDKVLTTPWIAPHLTHRLFLRLAILGSEAIDLKQFDSVLLNVRHPGWNSNPELLQGLVARLQKEPQFKLHYQQDDVFLFTRQS